MDANNGVYNNISPYNSNKTFKVLAITITTASNNTRGQGHSEIMVIIETILTIEMVYYSCTINTIVGYKLNSILK